MLTIWITELGNIIENLMEYTYCSMTIKVIQYLESNDNCVDFKTG